MTTGKPNLSIQTKERIISKMQSVAGDTPTSNQQNAIRSFERDPPPT